MYPRVQFKSKIFILGCPDYEAYSLNQCYYNGKSHNLHLGSRSRRSLGGACAVDHGSDPEVLVLGCESHGDQEYLGRPGGVAQLVAVSSRYAKVAGLILGQGTYKNQPMDASISGTIIYLSFALSLPPPPTTKY